jgi:hypothetical protein
MQEMLNFLTAIAIINLDIKKLILILEILVICNTKFGDNFVKSMQKSISIVQVGIPGKSEV